MLRKNTRKTTAQRQAIFDERERERIKNEMRDFAVREGKKALQDTLKQFEQDFTRASSVGGRNRQSSSDDSGLDFSSFGASLVGFATRLFTSNNKSRISESAATETERSRNENTFYSQSRSQQEAALSISARKGERNL